MASPQPQPRALNEPPSPDARLLVTNQHEGVGFFPGPAPDQFIGQPLDFSHMATGHLLPAVRDLRVDLGRLTVSSRQERRPNQARDRFHVPPRDHAANIYAGGPCVTLTAKALGQ